MSVYKVVELIGVSDISWDEAAKNALNEAGKTLHDLRIAEVGKLDIKVENGRPLFRTRLEVSFKVLAGE
jgi:flavin-binding protein dodecin